MMPVRMKWTRILVKLITCWEIWRAWPLTWIQRLQHKISKLTELMSRFVFDIYLLHSCYCYLCIASYYLVFFLLVLFLFWYSCLFEIIFTWFLTFVFSNDVCTLTKLMFNVTFNFTVELHLLQLFNISVIKSSENTYVIKYLFNNFSIYI